MRNWILFATVLLWITYLSGCATHPPAQIIDDRYINFEYGYSIEIPEGWEIRDEVPQVLHRYFGGFDKKKYSIMLINEDTKGLILSWNDKFRKDFSGLIYMTDRQVEEMADSVKEGLASIPKIRDTKTESKNKNLDFTITRYRQNPRSFKPEELLTGSAEGEKYGNIMQLYFDLFVYPCNGGKTCTAHVFLVSPKEKSEQNLAAFNELSDSLLRHDNSSQ